MANESIYKKISDLVSGSAPVLGRALGSFSPVAGLVVKLIADAFGLDATKPESILEMIMAKPDSAIKLKELELKHSEEILRLTYSDNANARNMQIAMRGTFSTIVPHIIAFIVISIYAFIQFQAIMHVGNADDVISARVQDALMLVLTFYFGGAIKQNWH